MSKGLVFWILMLIALIFGGYAGFVAGASYLVFGPNLLLWILLALLGWAEFGPPIQ